MFTPPAPRQTLYARMQQTVADAIDWAALALCASEEDDIAAAERRLIGELAEIDDLADQMAAGSGEARRRMRHVRGLIGAVLSLMTSARTARHHVAHTAMSDDRLDFATVLVGAATELRSGRAMAIGSLRQLLTAAHFDPPLAQTLDALVTSLADIEADRAGLGDMPSGRASTRFVPHRDWRGAWIAAIRAVTALLGVGGIWLATGWEFGPYMVMSVAIFACVLSTHDQPTAALRMIVSGATIGAAAGLFCHLVLLPYAGDRMTVLLMLTPFLLAGGLGLAHPKTAKAALDANMVFLLVSQPMLPLRGTPLQAFEGTAALLLGMAMALLVYRFVLPVNPTRRMADLSHAIARDLYHLATSRSAEQRQHLEIRLRHRVLRLVLRARDMTEAAPKAETVNGALATLGLSNALNAMLRPANSDLPPSARNILAGAIRHLRDMSHAPGQAAASLRAATSDLMRMAG